MRHLHAVTRQHTRETCITISMLSVCITDNILIPHFCHQCFDTVGWEWASGRAPGL